MTPTSMQSSTVAKISRKNNIVLSLLGFPQQCDVFFSDISNAEFYCGKAEEVLPKLIGRFQNEKVVAVVDPPRSGLRKPRSATWHEFSSELAVVPFQIRMLFGRSGRVRSSSDSCTFPANQPLLSPTLSSKFVCFR